MESNLYYPQDKDYKAALDGMKYDRVSNALANSRIPSHMHNTYKLEAFDVREGLEDAYKAVCDFAECKEDTPPFLTLMGKPGTGKTRLAIGCALKWIEADGDSVIYWQVEDLLDKLQLSQCKPEYEQIMDDIENCSLLILDDLGVENVTDWRRAKIDQIIDKRYEHRSWTIITCNVSADSISERVASRLKEGTRVLIKASDYREIKGSERQ